MNTSRKKDYGTLIGFANVILIGSGGFCVLLVLYLLYYYVLTGQRNFSSQAAKIVYFLLPAALATFLFSSLRLKPFLRISLSILVFSSGLSIYAANLFLALYDAKLTAYKAANRTLWFEERDLPIIVRVAKEHGVEFDTRNRLDVIDALYARGIEAVPSFIPIGRLKEQNDGIFRSAITIDGAEVLPLGGISNKTTVMCNESGQYQSYESDEHGFHNPKGIWSLSRIDVVALGDSFTHGHCVSSDRNFVALIRNKYPNTLNLGMNGEGPMIMLATLKEYAQLLKPKLVLWFFWEGNDITDLDSERRSPLLRRYLESDFSQSLKQRQRDIDQALASYFKLEKATVAAKAKSITNTVVEAGQFLDGLITLSHLRQRIGLAWRNSSSRELDLTTNINVLHGALKEAKKLVEAWGGKLYFVYLPAHMRYSDPSNAEGFRDRVILLVEKLGIQLIDVHPAFQAQPDPLALFPFRRMGHYNEQGHRTVAEVVVEHIAQ